MLYCPGPGLFRRENSAGLGFSRASEVNGTLGPVPICSQSPTKRIKPDKPKSVPAVNRRRGEQARRTQQQQPPTYPLHIHWHVLGARRVRVNATNAGNVHIVVEPWA